MWTSPGCVPLRSHAATAAPAKLRALAVGEPGCLASSGDDGERRAHAPHLRRAAPEPDPEPEPWAEAALRDAFAAFPLFGSASAGLWPDSEEEEEDEDDDELRFRSKPPTATDGGPAGERPASEGSRGRAL